MSAAPILFLWDGEAMRPYGRFTKEADREYVVGERYLLVEQQQRSRATHSHYFASLTDAWSNLPEHLAEQFPTMEHLRKWCLIKAGYARKQQSVWPSNEIAERVAALARPLDTYAIVTVDDCVVTIWTAMSQSMKAMDRKTFQASKDAVLDLAAWLIQVPTGSLRSEAGRAA